MTLPAVSFLMPVRNEARYLPAALDSLYRQTCTDWELVVVDDGSTDETPAILAAAKAQDRRMRVLTIPGQGLVSALNEGLAACRAPLVARMDGDDIAHPRRLEFQTAYLNAHPDVGLLASSFRHFPRSGLRIGMLTYETWQNNLGCHDHIIRDLYVESPFVHPTVMLRRDELLSVGGYRDMGWAEDYDLWLRLIAGGTRCARLPQALLFWRDRPERATRSLPAYSAAAFRACKLHHLLNGFLRGIHGVTLVGAGREGRAWHRTLRERRIEVQRWVDVDPRKIGRVLHGAPVHAAGTFTIQNGERLLVTVGTRGAREQIRRWAQGAGLRDGTEYLCVT